MENDSEKSLFHGMEGALAICIKADCCCRRYSFHTLLAFRASWRAKEGMFNVRRAEPDLTVVAPLHLADIHLFVADGAFHSHGGLLFYKRYEVTLSRMIAHLDSREGKKIMQEAAE